jgi:N-acetylglucosaminyldiphosphoundecaprenol N-acetyl-beta-D-mannosaminyltransferase
MHSTAARPKFAELTPTRPSEGQPLRFGSFVITETAEFPPPRLPECWVYITLNAEIALSLRSNPELRTLTASQRVRISVDGQWILWALRRKYPEHTVRKLSGSDLIYTLAAHCSQQGKRLFLLGASAASNAGAVQALRSRWPGLQVAGYSMRPFAAGQASEAEALADSLRAIRAAGADYVVMGLDPTKLYSFAALLARELDGDTSGVLCFGGAIDMASGRVRRAPRWCQTCGLESIYRVLREPSPTRLRRWLKMTLILPLLASGRY